MSLKHKMMFKTPEQLSEAELLELLRDKQDAKKNIPPPLMAPDFPGLVKEVDEILQDAVKHGRGVDRAWIFEAVMKAIYGPDFFKWYNNSGICR